MQKKQERTQEDCFGQMVAEEWGKTRWQPLKTG